MAPQRDIKAEIAGREGEVLGALGIAWPPHGSQKHIRCPFPDHEDKNPSWRWDGDAGKWFCSCGSGDVLDAVQRMGRAQDFIGAADFARDVCGLEKPAPKRANGANGHAGTHATSEKAAKPEWQPIHSVPVDAHKPPKTHFKFGAPSQRWEYRDAEDRLVGYVCRFDFPDGSKEIWPLTYCQHSETGELAWRWKAFAKPRPLYGLELLADNPDAPVLVVEGEKTADAAEALFPDRVTVTWPGGTGAAGLADWSALQDRDVVLWPDHDLQVYPEGHARAGDLKPWQEQPGIKAMLQISSLLEGGKSEAASVHIVDTYSVDTQWPDGWDLADAPPAGVDVRALVDAAKAPEELNPKAGHDPANEVFGGDERLGSAKPYINGHAQADESTYRTPLEIVDADELLGNPAPPRSWHVDGLIPGDDVTLLGADGGTGKSTLALQLANATRWDIPWLEKAVRTGPAIYLSAEESIDELHYRLQEITAPLMLPPPDYPLKLISRADTDAVLGTPDSGEIVPTPLFDDLRQLVVDLEARLLVLDAAADVYGGNEIDRAQVRSFIRLLRSIGTGRDCAVLLLAHPSADGIKTGRGYSGSTHWNNAVRSRFYFTKPTADEGGDDEAGRDLRELTLAKANRARADVSMTLRWKAGYFVVEHGAGDAIEAAHTRGVFLDLLRQRNAQGRSLSPYPSNNYAPSRLAEDPGANGLTSKQLERAMEALFSERRIAVEEFGPQSKRRSRIVEVEE